MELLDTVFFLVLIGAGVLNLSDAKMVLDERGRAMLLPMVQYGIGGLLFLVFGFTGVLTEATMRTLVPGPWTRYDATAAFASIGVVSMLVLLAFVLPPKRHLDRGRSPTLDRLVERLS